MFAKSLTELPFTSASVSQCLNNMVHTSTFRNDKTLCALSNALLMDRLPQGEGFEGMFISDSTGHDFTRRVRNSASANCSQLFFINVNCDNDIVNDVFAVIDEKVKYNFNGFEHIEVIGEWWKQHNFGTVRLYIDENAKRSLMFVHSMNLKRFHLAVAFFNRMVPWFFKDKPLNEKERSLVASLAKMDGADEFCSILQELYDAVDFRSKNIERYVKDFEKNSYQTRIDQINRSISDKREEMNRTMDRYNAMVREFDSLNITLSGLLCRQADTVDNELMEYFVANKELIPNGNGDLGFVVNTYLEYFDVDMADRMLSNRHSYMYEDAANAPGVMRNNRDAIEKFWRAIFSDEPKLKLKICSNYNFTRGYVNVVSYFTYPEESYNHIPNPHINRFACLGAYKTYIQQALDSNDIITAIQQCIASARSVNIGEFVSITELIRCVYDSRAKCIELPNGTCVTPEEAYIYLVEEENK